MNRADQRKVLEAFTKDFNRETHNLRERPDILWQQLYNRLQWHDDNGPVSRVIAPEFQRRQSPGTRPWFHNRVKTKESEAFIRLFKGHTDRVLSCCFSPDGKTVASASHDKTVRLWDAATGDERAVLEGHTRYVNSCCFSPDGKTVASASGDSTGLKGYSAGLSGNTVRLWDAETGAQRAVVEGHSCCFSPDGKTVASASYDNTVRLWDAATGRPIAAYTCIGDASCCAFSPLHNTIASGDKGGNIYILELIGFDTAL